LRVILKYWTGWASSEKKITIRIKLGWTSDNRDIKKISRLCKERLTIGKDFSIMLLNDKTMKS
jgi:hypothetical protein